MQNYMNITRRKPNNFSKKKSITKLTDKEKALKYETELTLGIKITNDLVTKLDAKGNYIKLNEKDKSYRHGFLARHGRGTK